MLDANYEKHLKVLGKLCYAYDQAVADLAGQELTAERFFDQVATGASGSWQNLLLASGFAPAWAAAMTNGSEAIKTLMSRLAGYYLTSAEFRDDFVVEAPADPTSAQSVLVALIAELDADSKTLTTAAATGLVHFFETEWAPTGDFLQSESPSYADATYVVQTVVA